jgi:hypothetical protein
VTQHVSPIRLKIATIKFLPSMINGREYWKLPLVVGMPGSGGVRIQLNRPATCDRWHRAKTSYLRTERNTESQRDGWSDLSQM